MPKTNKQTNKNKTKEEGNREWKTTVKNKHTLHCSIWMKSLWFWFILWNSKSLFFSVLPVIQMDHKICRWLTGYQCFYISHSQTVNNCNEAYRCILTAMLTDFESLLNWTHSIVMPSNASNIKDIDYKSPDFTSVLFLRSSPQPSNSDSEWSQ